MGRLKASTSFRLSDETLAVLARIARYYDIDRTAVLTMIVREKGYALGLAKPAATSHKAKATR